MRRPSMRPRALTLFAIVCACTTLGFVAAQNPYPDGGVVRALTDDDFEALVMENGRESWAIAFHTDGCAPCASMAPHFTKAAKSLDGIVNFGHVHVSEDSPTMSIVQRVGLTRVPMVLGFPAHKLINPYGGPSAKQSVEYRNSTSSSKKIADFAASLLPDRAVRRVDSPEALADARSDHPDLPVSALVTAKDATGSLYKSLALRFRRRAVFVEVHADHVAAVLPDAGLAPENAPALVVLPSDDAAPAARHEGEMNAASLAAFLDARAAPAPEDDAPEERDPREENARDRTLSDTRTRGKSPEDTSMFPAVTPGEFDSHVLTVEPVVAVLFTRLGERRCLNASREVGTALLKMVGQVQMMELNVSDAGAAELAERFAPTTTREENPECVELVLFPHGRDKEDADPETYEGEIAPEPLATWMHEHVPDFVMPITDRLVDTFLQAEPLKPKVILFHASETPPREFVALAANFMEDFLFALIPESDKASAEKFGVTSYPTIRLLFIPPLEPGENPPPEGLQYRAAEFPSRGLAYVEMHGWLQQVQMQVLGKDLGQGDAARAQKPEPKPVREVSTPEAFDDACGSSALCVVAFIVGGGGDEDGENTRDAERAVIRAVAAETSDRPFSFVYVDPVAQRSFAAAFEVTASDAPAVTVVSVRKNRFATYSRAFDAEGVGSFLEDVLAAKQRTRMIQEIPKLTPGGEEPEPEMEEMVEEEFDLSDILGEEVEGEAAMSKEQLAAKIERELEEEAAAAAAKAAEEEAAKAADTPKKKKKKKKKGKKAKESEL